MTDFRVLIHPGHAPDQGTIYKSLAPAFHHLQNNPPVGIWGQDITNMNDNQIVALVILGCDAFNCTIDRQANKPKFRSLLHREKKALKALYGMKHSGDVDTLRGRVPWMKSLLDLWNDLRQGK
ncbi:hypothetical protein FPOAC1_003868 [Fusarium poae]|uniref:hypothetical protein n=1 Tax=Fusarium poae TaxID=36050 RepID=UPI001CEB1EEE|nr:hypothetical protein FPOAC1_003868 [Fusarium poae]KAG8677840.1 hypothetical protein FPOAC1_003868 [Fusarium poae]